MLPLQGSIKLGTGRRTRSASLAHFSVEIAGSSNSRDFCLRGLGKMVSLKWH